MTHIATRLPEEVEIGAVRRDPEDVEIVRTDNGGEVRNVRASQSLLEFDISYPHSEQDANFLEVRAAYKAARGMLHSFDFQDHSEFEAADEVIGEGDGAEDTFDLIKTYTFGSTTHQRRIYRPVSPIDILLDGVVQIGGYTADYTAGTVTFDSAPALGVEISWTGEFNVPVRFDTPFQVSLPAGHLVHIDTMTLVEVRL